MANMDLTPDSSPRSDQSASETEHKAQQKTQEPLPPQSFTHPPDASLPAAAELEYLTHTSFLAIKSQPIPTWMHAHIAANFRSHIDALSSASWAEHVANFAALAAARGPRVLRITDLSADVDEAKAHADVFCHMEDISLPAAIRRQGMAQLRWKRHPFDGRWQLVHIMGMREPPSDLGGVMSAAAPPAFY